MDKKYKYESNLLNDNTYHIYNYNSSMHFKIGKKEYELLINQDEEFISYLEDLNFFKKKKLKNKIFNFKIPVLKFNFKKNKFSILIEKIFWISLMISIVLFTYNYNPKISFVFSSNYLIYYFIVFISLFLHELGHWLFSVNRNVLIPEIGINFKYLLPLPMMYTDAAGIRYIPKYIDRLICVYSGILINIFLLSSSYIIWMYTKNNVFLDVWEININILLINVSWYLKLDGYYMLSFFLGNDEISNKKVTGKKRIIKTVVTIIQIAFFTYAIISILGGLLWKFI